MRVEIFDVEHGGCALVTADTGARLLIDCGHNSTTGWRPSVHLSRIKTTTIEQLVITNYDEDHVSDLPNLRHGSRSLPAVNFKSFFQNNSISVQALEKMKKDGGMGEGIRELITMLNTYIYDAPIFDWGSLSYRGFHNNYPDFDDTNNLSLVLFVHCYGLHMIFPGDLEEAGWKKLLENPEFVKELKTVNVFVASHHGRESGCCEKVFEIVKPQIVLFSDAGLQYDTQNTVSWYRERCKGIDYSGERRYVFTTRNDGKITLNARPDHVRISTAL